jgi:hypothetical protein
MKFNSNCKMQKEERIWVVGWVDYPIIIPLAQTGFIHKTKI